ncbi:hypothetical protein [Ralstonia solanacearum]|uniref:hypothetical protein n=1 Tax=Ralstonia solanacearum TaxID=305 RepID=UPI00078C810E|nr:hypothetical protein [Ralstonia solanacearum]AMP39866.1 hypothetical protein LBM2029_20005 [Ralstonia solanacearum]AXV88709.1 hypothetical protein CJO78_20585 [Ralstonia solanacearum]AXW08182.1 hypothetical protein CJO82_20245 [Ralstonia solanacearum]AXW25973.1 hypothetical protein CJO86_20510 [Ralstonia solanacearum]AXW82882.1 hypothetical protein CJO98_20605 [Ralstonia solanacearum]
MHERREGLWIAHEINDRPGQKAHGRPVVLWRKTLDGSGKVPQECDLVPAEGLGFDTLLEKRLPRFHRRQDDLDSLVARGSLVRAMRALSGAIDPLAECGMLGAAMLSFGSDKAIAIATASVFPLRARNLPLTTLSIALVGGLTGHVLHAVIRARSFVAPGFLKLGKR